MILLVKVKPVIIFLNKSILHLLTMAIIFPRINMHKSFPATFNIIKYKVYAFNNCNILNMKTVLNKFFINERTDDWNVKRVHILGRNNRRILHHDVLVVVVYYSIIVIKINFFFRIKKFIFMFVCILYLLVYYIL